LNKIKSRQTSSLN